MKNIAIVTACPSGVANSIIAAGLLLVIAFFIFRGLRQKQKANIALEEKNKIGHRGKAVTQLITFLSTP
jgi:fructose-specific phosphotransferase system component IIB